MQLIKDTYAVGGLDFAQTHYFEAYGTGTPVGDPIKASAIANVFNPSRSAEVPLIIGAVKSNVGHLAGVAGIGGLMKTVMVLESGIIPPNLWFEKPNPSIPLDEWNPGFLWRLPYGPILGFDARRSMPLVMEVATPMSSWRTHTITWRNEDYLDSTEMS